MSAAESLNASPQAEQAARDENWKASESPEAQCCCGRKGHKTWKPAILCLNKANRQRFREGRAGQPFALKLWLGRRERDVFWAGKSFHPNWTEGEA